MGLEGYNGEDSTHGVKELEEVGDSFTLRTGSVTMGMESMIQHSTCQRFGTDYKDLIAMMEEPQAWPNFSTELEIIQTLRLCFSDFKISYVPRTQNEIADSLARNAHSFHRSLCLNSCSIPVWLPRPPQV